MRTRTFALLASVAVLLLVSACGSQDSTPAEAAPPTEVSTTAPTTTIPLSTYSPEEVLAALPTIDDVPAGWSERPVAATIRNLEPGEGPGVGWCGGKNRDSLAIDAGVLYVADSPSFEAPDSGGVSSGMGVLVFPTEQSASAFLDAQPDTCETRTDQVSEEFIDAFQDDDAGMWDYTQSLRRFSADESQADERFGRIFEELVRSAGSDEFGFERDRFIIMERHRNLVIVSTVVGVTNVFGFGNDADATGREPTVPEIEELASLYVSTVLGRLGAE